LGTVTTNQAKKEIFPAFLCVAAFLLNSFALSASENEATKQSQ
jgi:hypothetical protein